MKQFIAFVNKETKHILRDKRTMLILFGMPVVMMLLFGFAITTDVKNVRTVVVTSEMSPRTQQAVERLAQSEYFVITQTVNTPREAEQLIRSQKADMSLTPSPSPKGEGSSNLQWQIMVDGSDPNMAQQWTTYAQSILSQPVDGKHYSLPSPFKFPSPLGEGLGVRPGLGVRLLYNPQMKSAYNFVPAIMGMSAFASSPEMNSSSGEDAAAAALVLLSAERLADLALRRAKSRYSFFAILQSHAFALSSDLRLSMFFSALKKVSCVISSAVRGSFEMERM